jgi:D-glycero-D-manno-heptose 1,7-bisphosphate phosphatase
MMKKAVFLDLNGTLVMPVQVESPSEYQPIAGSIEAVRLLNAAGFLCPVITVQTRIQKGYFSEATFRAWFGQLQRTWAKEEAYVHGLYLCPHSSQANCDCYKPKPKLYLDAAHDHDINCAQSYVVGDTLGDLQAGKTIGAKTCFVQTGWADRFLPEHAHEADFVGADILAVAKWIIQDNVRQ